MCFQKFNVVYHALYTWLTLGCKHEKLTVSFSWVKPSVKPKGFFPHLTPRHMRSQFVPEIVFLTR